MFEVTPVIHALRQRFISQWGNTTPVTYDLAPEGQRPAPPYVHFRIERGSSKRYLGNSETGEGLQFGRVWLQVFVAPDEGEGVALSLLDRFGAIFGNWQHANPNIECQLPDSGPEGEVAGLHMMSLSVRFEALLPYSG